MDEVRVREDASWRRPRHHVYKRTASVKLHYCRRGRCVFSLGSTQRAMLRNSVTWGILRSSGGAIRMRKSFRVPCRTTQCSSASLPSVGLPPIPAPLLYVDLGCGTPVRCHIGAPRRLERHLLQSERNFAFARPGGQSECNLALARPGRQSGCDSALPRPDGQFWARFGVPAPRKAI